MPRDQGVNIMLDYFLFHPLQTLYVFLARIKNKWKFGYILVNGKKYNLELASRLLEDSKQGKTTVNEIVGVGTRREKEVEETINSDDEKIIGNFLTAR